MNEPLPEGRGLDPGAEPIGDTRHPLYPWLTLCVPFTVLAIFVAILITRSDLGSRLTGLSASRLEERQRYAIDHTPESSVALIRAAFANPEPESWSAGEAWAVDDLLIRAEGEAGVREGADYELLIERFHAAFPQETP